MNWLDILEPITKVKDRRSPLYLRLTNSIRTCIESGTLVENDKLPPDRELAKLLKVDRSTIARAYDQLEADGLISSHVGRGTFVKQHQAERSIKPQAVTGDKPNTIVWADKFSRASQDVSFIAQRQLPLNNTNTDAISFSAGAPTDEFFPQKEFQEIVSSLLASEKSLEMFGYSQPEGHPALREQVQIYLKKQGINVADDELLILSGSQQGIDLVGRTLLDPNDVVLMEDPTYFWAICNFTACGARCTPVATDEHGLRLDQFESAASRVNAKLMYTMPSFQNPTGSTMPLDRRHKLLELARKHGVPILEDNFVGDLSYGESLPSLRSLDTDGGTVIYQGTFSKALCPGLRLGWLVAPEPLMTRLRLAKRTCDLSTNSMAQVILAEYLKRGLYAEHLAVVQAEYKTRLEVMCDALTRHASQWLTWRKPAGGMFIWAKLPPGYSARELFAFAEREGVTFSPGDVFFSFAGRQEFMRLTFIQQQPELIEEGVARLGRALKAYGASRKRVAKPGDSYQVSEATFI